ncbi:MAG: NigD-like N-terminal domain-containing protein [Paludibacter sp.]|jgi:hypothetical protein|nr:NigD-like N-terminal domain-containing protein [Paludibacter sp.]
MKKLLTGIIVLFLIISCNNDDVNSNDKNWQAIATVENPTLATEFNFRLDNGDLMHTNTTALLNYKPKDGQRIIANYSIIEPTLPASSTIKSNVRLNDAYEILTKGIFKIKPAQQDSIGNNEIEIKSIWVGSDYLNVEFVYLGYNKNHYINLVSDDAKTYTDNKVHLEFRHNANSDYPSSSKWGMASFDLRSLKVNHNPNDSVKMVIHTKEYGTTTDKTYPLTYKFGVPTAAQSAKIISLPFNADNKIQ